uniref:Uncharacterized protein n=1 Tax=Sphaerodactylus townsendi TaxID=933632 RepID=A0ACB8E9L1_9SAUR
MDYLLVIVAFQGHLKDVGISPTQRDEVIHWLAKLKYQFHLYPETLALAVSLLDRFLAAVKARPKYLNCIAISCFFLAAKTIEEDEDCLGFCDNYTVACSHPNFIYSLARKGSQLHRSVGQRQLVAVLQQKSARMEKIILDKLNWDLHTADPLDFLPHFPRSAALSTRPQLHGHLAKIDQSQPWLCSQAPPLPAACYQLPAMDSSQLIHCRELVAQHLSPVQPSLPPNSVYVYSPLKHNLVTCHTGALRFHPSSVPGPDSKDNRKPEVPNRGSAALCQRRLAPSRCKQATAKRKVEEMEVDDFYDGIKRLYNEENVPEGVALEGKAASACGADVSRQAGSVSPCPPLQPVSVM